MTPTREDYLWMWLHAATGAYAGAFYQILNRCHSVHEAYELAAGRNTSVFAPWGDKIKKRLLDTANEAWIEERANWLQRNKIDILPLCREEYPALLKEISNPPAVLFVKGTLPAKPTLPIAMIGMRNCTAYGEGVARHFASALVKEGGTIVSGMALGIDAHAAQGALRVADAQHPTIAVLGSGVDVIYPSDNGALYHEIVERGAVISEFLPGTRPLREHFPVRNRIISGLSRGVLVVEAAQRSGTSITAGYALEQSRDVFAIPGRITDACSVGANSLIQRGEAKPVFCVADILCEYGIQELRQAASRPEVRKVDLSKLTADERLIVEQLQKGEKSADELSEILSWPIARINSTLTSLQFSGIMKQLPGKVFGI